MTKTKILLDGFHVDTVESGHSGNWVEFALTPKVKTILEEENKTVALVTPIPSIGPQLILISTELEL